MHRSLKNSRGGSYQGLWKETLDFELNRRRSLIAYWMAENDYSFLVQVSVSYRTGLLHMKDNAHKWRGFASGNEKIM